MSGFFWQKILPCSGKHKIEAFTETGNALKLKDTIKQSQ